MGYNATCDVYSKYFSFFSSINVEKLLLKQLTIPNNKLPVFLLGDRLGLSGVDSLLPLAAAAALNAFRLL